MKKENAMRLAGRKTIQLEAPSLPEAVQEQGQWVIHVDELSPNQKIVVQIPNYQNTGWHPSFGDRLRGYLNDTPSDNYIYLDKSNIDNASWDAEFDPENIPNGAYVATYTRINAVDDCASSLPTPVTIEGSTSSKYPGPVFPDANNGVLLYTKIAQCNGTPVRTQYDVQQGDQVVFYWRGFDETGQEIPEAAYVSGRPLTVQDACNGYIEDTIPLRSIQLLGDFGSGVAYYEVLRDSATRVSRNTKSLHVSLNTEVEIAWADITALQLSCTQGAANTSSQLPNLKPCNYGAVFGAPGLAVTISVSAGGVIAEATGGDPTIYTTQLNGDGLARFSVSSKDQSLVCIAAYSQVLPGSPPTVNATFSQYADGGASGIVGYNYTSAVPCDGVTACCIYFKVSPRWVSQGVAVTIVDEESQARVVGADPETPHARTIKLFADGTGFAEIVDTCEEKVNVTLSVPGQQEAIRFPYPVEFISFPCAS